MIAGMSSHSIKDIVKATIPSLTWTLVCCQHEQEKEKGKINKGRKENNLIAGLAFQTVESSGGKLSSLRICWWECKLVQSLWKPVSWLLRKWRISLPQGPAIPLLGTYPNDIHSYYKKIC